MLRIERRHYAAASRNGGVIAGLDPAIHERAQRRKS
jgi:hypothetical protein